MISSLINDTGEKIDLSPYEPYTYLRALTLTLLVGGILAVIVTQVDFSSLAARSIAPWELVVGVNSAVALVTGVGIILYRAKSHLAQGKLIGSDHWKKCMIVRPAGTDRVEGSLCHLDVSQLDSQGTGVARLCCKTPFDATQTGWYVATAVAPLYVAIVALYNVVRLVVIPFYVAVQLLKESVTGKALFPTQRPFSLSDIPRHMLISVGRVIQAPFYGVALTFTALYALLDPLNGIKWGSGVEYEWNDRVPMRDSGIWMVAFQIFGDWQWEGGGGPNTLGQNGFYAAGSWLPVLSVHCVKGKITRFTTIEVSNPQQVQMLGVLKSFAESQLGLHLK